MKFIVLLTSIGFVCGVIYLFFTHFKLLRKINIKALIAAASIGVILLGFLAYIMFKSATAPDTWCNTVQNASSYPPAELKTAMDYFEKGNYDYDTGNCKQAIIDYTKSIEMNFKYPQAYNNRAYTYMRMRDYKNALADLNQALEINPNYIQALMNRGDIHNYYFEIDKAAAIADYEKIISIAGTRGTSVCGHLYLAEHNGWNLWTVLNMPSGIFSCRNSSK